MPAARLPFRFFERGGGLSVVDRRLPHWSQSGTLCFITWRAYDSVPASVLAEFVRERQSWLARWAIDPTDENWRRRVADLPRAVQLEFHCHFSGLWNDWLDAGHGACPLRHPELASVVADSLTHFDGERYLLTDFVVMPNHVHLVAAFPEETAMLRQCESWKHFTASRINKHLGRTGRFWQADAFDRLVRSADQFEAVRKYIAENPVKASLKAGEFVHYSRPFDTKHDSEQSK